METKKWNAMITSVEQGSFTRAAEKMDCTQSGLTHMMDSLEKEVGFPLLVRNRNGVRFTPEGERLLPAVQGLLNAEERLVHEIMAQKSENRENVRVAVCSTICMRQLPVAVQKFRQKHPDVSIDIRIGSTEEARRWIQEGKVSFAFMGNMEGAQEDFRWIPLWTGPMYAILPPAYHAEGKTCFPIRDLEGQTFLMPPTSLESVILYLLREEKVNAQISHVILEDGDVISKVDQGEGFSILPEAALRYQNCKALPLDTEVRASIGIAVTANEEITPIANEFIEFIRKIAKQIADRH